MTRDEALRAFRESGEKISLLAIEAHELHDVFLQDHDLWTNCALPAGSLLGHLSETANDLHAASSVYRRIADYYEREMQMMESRQERIETPAA